MFKIFECGCIGFVVCDDPRERAVYVVKPCDADGSAVHADLPCFVRRTSLERKNGEKLRPDEVKNLLEEINRALVDAASFHQIRDALRGAK